MTEAAALSREAAELQALVGEEEWGRVSDRKWTLSIP